MPTVLRWRSNLSQPDGAIAPVTTQGSARHLLSTPLAGEICGHGYAKRASTLRAWQTGAEGYLQSTSMHRLADVISATATLEYAETACDRAMP